MHFWFATLGVGLYVASLSIAGTLQGLTWASGSPFIASLAAAQPYWLSRAVGGTLMFAAHIAFAYNVYLMTFAPQRSAAPALPTTPLPFPAPGVLEAGL